MTVRISISIFLIVRRRRTWWYEQYELINIYSQNDSSRIYPTLAQMNPYYILRCRYTAIFLNNLVVVGQSTGFVQVREKIDR